MLGPLGVMQGRLLPKYKGRYQAHPIGYWQDEFPIAAELGLDCIEYIFDFNDAEKNPLLTLEGQQEIQDLCGSSGVKVLSVCADYFMESPLHAADESIARRSCDMLERLLFASSKLGLRDVVIPCVDQASIQKLPARERLVARLIDLVPCAEQFKVNLSLESDLPPIQFGELLSCLDSPRVTVNYDIGNSTSLGYDPSEEWNVYGKRVSDVHIKDRLTGGGSVQLGKGNADIPSFFQLLKRFNYLGPVVMQAYRDEEGISIFKEQWFWLEPYLLS